MSQTDLENQPLLINDSIKALEYQQATGSKRKSTSCSYAKCCILGVIGSLFLFIITIVILASVYINNQVHLSFTYSNTDNMTATWIGYKDYYNGDVTLDFFNINSPFNKTIIKPETTIMTEEYNSYRYIYRAEFPNLNHNSSYNYYINLKGSLYGPFDLFVQKKDRYQNKVLFLGDLNLFYSDIRHYFEDQKMIDYDFIFHLGNIAYNFDSFFDFMGDVYLSLLEPIASHIPYMTIPGNCEEMNNFSNYVNRFTMPNYKKTDNLYYTIERPPLKMINFNTDAYYVESMQPTLESQTNFIINELNNTNRTIFPWLIAAGHRPMYCVNSINDCVNWKNNKVRLALEDLFVEYNVTMYISANEYYQRLCPIYNGSCQSYIPTNYNFSLHNLENPIQIINGGDSFTDGYFENNWNDVIYQAPNFGVLEADYKLLKWTQYSLDSKNNPLVIDNFTITN